MVRITLYRSTILVMEVSGPSRSSACEHGRKHDGRDHGREHLSRVAPHAAEALAGGGGGCAAGRCRSTDRQRHEVSALVGVPRGKPFEAVEPKRPTPR